jgi:hypothetical protein
MEHSGHRTAMSMEPGSGTSIGAILGNRNRDAASAQARDEFLRGKGHGAPGVQRTARQSPAKALHFFADRRGDSRPGPEPAPLERPTIILAQHLAKAAAAIRTILEHVLSMGLCCTGSIPAMVRAEPTQITPSARRCAHLDTSIPRHLEHPVTDVLQAICHLPNFWPTGVISFVICRAMGGSVRASRNHSLYFSERLRIRFLASPG